jgi:hypothetical protein
VIRNACVLAVLCAEGLAVYTFAEWAASGYGAGHQHAIGAWAFLLAALLGYGAPRFLDGFDIAPRTAKLLLTALGVAVIYGAVRMEVAGDLAIWRLGWFGDFITTPDDTVREGRYAIIGVALMLVIWVRASLRAADEIELDMVARRVALPFGIVTAVVILGAATDRGGEIARAGVAFYAVEVLALACSQLALSGATIGDVRAGGVVSALLGGTLVVVLVSFAVLTLAIVYLGPIIGPPLGAALNAVLTIVLTPIAWALEKLFSALLGDSDPLKQLKLNPIDIGAQKDNPGAKGHSGWYDIALYLFRALALVLVLAAVVGVVWIVARLRRRARELRPADEVAAGAGSLGDDLRSLFGSLFRRGERRHSSEAAGVSRLYLEVLARAERDARPKLVGETAGEFAPVLSETFRADVTDDITHAFEQARYAGREPDARTLQDLEQRWRSVR